jgi:predicted NBD/HSP70 family sugar kinase
LGYSQNPLEKNKYSIETIIMSRKNIDSFALMAESNKRLVLEKVCRSGKISRANLARETNLQPTTISNIVAKLIEEGYLSNSVEGENRNMAGRPAKLLELDDESKLALGVDLEPDRLRLALVNVKLGVLAYSEFGLNRFAGSEEIIQRIISASRTLLSTNSSWAGKVVAAGVSLPGRIDIRRGIAHSSTNMPNWKDVEIVKSLESALATPVRIERSTHLAALSEKWRRPETRDRNVICVVMRTGVGISLLLRGQLYHGASNFDGELGHTCIVPNGKQCECGRQGCLETLISSSAIRELAAGAIEKGKATKLLEMASGAIEEITPEMIYELAPIDPDCGEIVRNIVRWLGLGLSNIVQVLNPDEVVVCGSIDLAERIVTEEMNAVFKDALLTGVRADLTVSVSPFKNRASLLGSAAMIFDELFHSPSLGLESQSMIAV